MKVLLVYRADTAADLFMSAVPVGLGIMAAVLRQKGVAAKVANYSAESWRQVAQSLAAEHADIIALSVFTHNREACKRIAREVKRIRPDCWVICGGPHASHAVTDLLSWPGVDGIVVGEGEEVLCEIADYRRAHGPVTLPADVAGLVVVKGSCRDLALLPKRAPISDLDRLPFAHYGLLAGHGVDVRHQAEFIITSRGCPSACVFCSSPGFWGSKIRFRSAASVVQELKAVQEELGLLYFSIRDDTFTADRKRVIEICRRIIDEKVYILWNCQSRVSTVDEEVLGWLKRAGCECIQFGIESGSPRLLEILGKKITPQQIRHAIAAARRVGLQVSVYLIAGVPGETAADLVATEALLAEVLPHDGQVSPLVYYPGTALFRNAVTAGQVSADLFAQTSAAALYVRSDPEGKRTVQRLISCLQRLQKRAQYQTADFVAQKRLLGYCHATNLQAGEWYATQGQWAAAQREYEEITHNEPANPWGWLALGELALMQDNLPDAVASLRTVHTLVPRHLPVLHTLAETARRMGNRREMEIWQGKIARLAAL